MKKKIIIISVLVFVVICLLIAYPFIMNRIEIKRLEKEVNYVNSYLHNDISYNEVEKYIKKDITTSKRSKMEKIIDDYSYNIINNVQGLRKLNISDFDISSSDKLDGYLGTLEKNKNEANKLKDDYKEINFELKDENLKNECDKILSNVDSDFVHKFFDNSILEIDTKYEMIKYLIDNKDNYSLVDNSLVFLKRKCYLEFSQKYGNILNSSLVKDEEAPVITASDINVYKGNKVDMNSLIKCVDKVDDNVTCNISGEYDINKVGSYDIKIKASDEVGNISEKSIKLIVKEKKKEKLPYYVEVIRNKNVVIVYGLDGNNKYSKIVKVFVCSVGLNNWTPTGTFTTSDKASWGALVGGVYGQYYTRIVKDILFHSVPYFSKSKSKLEWEEYNKLGSAASKGCVRLSVRDAKWLYDNCPKGTTVKIYDGDLPDGVVKPSPIRIDADSPNKGWDPTDPDKNNPWNK